MQKYSPLLVFGLAALGISRVATADPITLVSSSRAVVVSAGAGSANSNTTTLVNQDVLSNTIGITDPLTGANAMASAFLSSSVSAGTGTLTGHGTTWTSQNSTTVQAGAYAQAYYFVTFDLTNMQRFDFGATFSEMGSDATNRSNWESRLSYFPDGPNPHSAFDFTGTVSQKVSSSNILSPGRYGFVVNTGSNSFNIGMGKTLLDYTFSLKFSDPQAPAPVPEPASLLLLGMGLAGIAGRRRLTRPSN